MANNYILFYFIFTLFLTSSCSKKTFSIINVKDNYISYINGKNQDFDKNLFLSKKESIKLVKNFGTDSSDLINCPISKDMNDLLIYSNECKDFVKILNTNTEYNLLVTKQTSNKKCGNLTVDFIYCDLLENNKSTYKHIILFVIPVSNKSYKLFGHKYYEDN